MSHLPSFGEQLNVAVLGASGGIGRAFAERLASDAAVANLIAGSRTLPRPEIVAATHVDFDLGAEETIAASARAAAAAGPLHLVILATGQLHDGERMPEKRWRDLDADALTDIFRVNTIGPALVAKHFLPLLDRERRAAFCALSARVGSIGDNELGGWHGYRASKAALNMMIRTLSVELRHRNPGAFCLALHPGTVDTPLSAPFQRGVPDGKLFSPERAASQLLDVIDERGPSDTGGFFAWDGQPIPY